MCTDVCGHWIYRDYIYKDIHCVYDIHVVHTQKPCKLPTDSLNCQKSQCH